MSEQTGATDEPVEYVWVRLPVGFRNPPTVGLASSEHWARLKHGQILAMEHKTRPGDAVCITPEIAATAAEACEEQANRAGEEYEANCYPMLTPGRKGWLAEHDRYRAAAAALRGEG